MIRTAELVPNNNIKLIIRHSIRPSIIDPNCSYAVKLSKEGKLLAEFFGKNIEFGLGNLCSSDVPRCIQTLQSMLKARNEIKDIIINKEILNEVFIKDHELCKNTFINEGKMKIIIQKLSMNMELPGFFTLAESVKKMLDYIFLIGNENNKLDIFCTHDFHIALLYSALFCEESSVDIDNLRANWPMMLEGMFLWGNRNDFYSGWRGNIKHFKNFLV